MFMLVSSSRRARVVPGQDPDPYKSQKQRKRSAVELRAAIDGDRPGRIRTCNLFLPKELFVRLSRWVRVGLLNIGLAEHGLRPDGQVAGLMPVHGVIAQLRFRDLEVPGQRALNLVVVGRRPEVEIAERDVEASAVEAGMQYGLSIDQ